MLQYLMIGFSHFALFLLRISDLQADYYAQQIKELEEKFQKKVGEIGQIQLELKLIKEFHREKAAMEKELEDISLSQMRVCNIYLKSNSSVCMVADSLGVRRRDMADLLDCFLYSLQRVRKSTRLIKCEFCSQK